MNSKDKYSMTLIILIGLAVRIILSPYFTHYADMGLWQYWASEISRIGFNHFFNQIWTDYLPSYFYVLFALEKIKGVLGISDNLIFKIPAILSDLGSAVIIYKLAKKYQPKYRLLLPSLYLFNPAIFANSAMWGQVDGVGIFLLLLSLLLVLQQKVILLGLTMAILILFKPLYLIALPIFFLAQWQINSKKLIFLMISSALSSILITIPFTLNPLLSPQLIISRYFSSLGQYPFASINAFNFWGMLGQNWVPDKTLFLNLSYQYWGLIIFVIIFSLSLLLLAKTSRENLPKNLTFSLALVFLAIFTFATRAHERHMITALPFLLLLIPQGPIFTISYSALSLVYLFNLYFGIYYLYLKGKFIFDQGTVELFSATVVFITLILVVLLINQILKVGWTMKKFSQYILIVIIIFTATTRLIRLDYPKTYVFDEVYHAFTAQEYLKGHKEAWEWWTTPPPKVAYEWTHPPLAKEIMAASMFIIGSTDSWAWRLPGVVLGTISVLLIYLLGKTLFRSESLALISAFIFSIDGLNFVQSRTGMNDIYLVTFVLVSLLFFLKKRILMAALFFGLALTSKWTAVYILPLYLFLGFQNRQLQKLFYFVIFPPLIYLASYIPFFLLGHSFDQFIELQKQMWWYHTHLKAAHDYASPAWSWPLNFYPVWYFVDYLGDKIANIFASGNPLLFWIGAGAILITFWEAIVTSVSSLREGTTKQSSLIILLGYFLFWLPWLFSPRIMFLYHYSPSVPFLSLILGYQLNKLWEDKKSRPTLIIILTLFLLSFILVFPFLTGIPLPHQDVQLFFLTNITKNPF